MEPISIITSALSTVKSLMDINKKINNAKFASLLSDLSIELAEVKSQLASMIIENTNLKNELLKIQNKEMDSTEMKFENGFYYSKSGDGPFCTACWDVKKDKIRLKKVAQDFVFAGDFECPACHNLFSK